MPTRCACIRDHNAAKKEADGIARCLLRNSGSITSLPSPLLVCSALCGRTPKTHVKRFGRMAQSLTDHQSATHRGFSNGLKARADRHPSYPAQIQDGYGAHPCVSVTSDWSRGPRRNRPATRRFDGCLLRWGCESRVAPLRLAVRGQIQLFKPPDVLQPQSIHFLPLRPASQSLSWSPSRMRPMWRPTDSPSGRNKQRPTRSSTRSKRSWMRRPIRRSRSCGCRPGTRSRAQK